VKLATQLHLVPRFRIHGAISPLLHTTSWRDEILRCYLYLSSPLAVAVTLLYYSLSSGCNKGTTASLILTEMGCNYSYKNLGEGRARQQESHVMASTYTA
jgi:hypothetical protein